MREKREYFGVFEPTDQRPPAPRNITELEIKNALRLRTLLALGALIQTLLFAFLPYTLALLPALLLALHAVLTTLAYTVFLSESPVFRRVIPGRATALIPSWYTGGYSTSSSASTPLVVFHMVAGFNHPLGRFCPGGKEVVAAMKEVEGVLSTRGEEFGLVGWSRWMGMGREEGNKIMVVAYFRTVKGLDRFAACEEHRGAMEGVGERGFVSLVHETFEVAPGRWGFVGVDSEPVLLGDGACRVMDEKGVWVWVRSLVREERL